MSQPIITRFAPSPTGPLHLGHAYAALFAFDAARETGGRFLLRIEDLDLGRARPEYEAAIYEDLSWLGITWETPVMRQSERVTAYAQAAADLTARGLTYPCFCTRKDILIQIEASGAAPHGPDGPVYPGLCRELSTGERESRIAKGEPYALRLDMEKALAQIEEPLTFQETGRGPEVETGLITAQPALFGDIVLMRKDAPASYHLAVVVDDAAQGVTLVTRGEDLFAAAHVQRLLQALLDLPTPLYRHHRLIRDETGKRLAKRDAARALSALKAEGISPDDIRRRVGLAVADHQVSRPT